MSAPYLKAIVSSQICIGYAFYLYWSDFCIGYGLWRNAFFNAFLIIEQTYLNIKQKLCNQNGWKELPHKYHCIHLGKFIWFLLGSFLRNTCEYFSFFDLKHSLPNGRLFEIVRCHYLNLVIFLSILGLLFCLLQI